MKSWSPQLVEVDKLGLETLRKLGAIAMRTHQLRADSRDTEKVSTNTRLREEDEGTDDLPPAQRRKLDLDLLNTAAPVLLEL